MYLPVHAWLLAFLITAVVEAPIVARLVRGGQPDGWPLLVLVLFANLATHPVIWFVLPQVLYVGTPEFLLAAELWAVTAEALFYGVAVRGISPTRAAATAIVANAASFVVGLAVTELLPQAFI